MIEWIVTSSALILLVLLLRVLVRDRVSPRLRYALWGLVLLRLVIPGTFWESRASVMAPVAGQEVYREIQNIPRYVHTRPDGGVDIGHPSGGGWTTIPAEIASSDEPAFVDTKSGQTSTVSDTIRQVTVRNAFLLVWLAGSVLTGAFLLAVNLRFERRLKKNRQTLEQYLGLWVFTMEGLATPCLFGLFRPGIYLTQGLAEHEKIHVLAHEYTHFRQRDHLWAALRGVCLALHWYNPLVWLAAYLSRRDCELSCDEGAVRLLGEENRADYGRTLVGLVARRTTPRDLACCATTMTGGKSALKERIALLVKHPRTTAAMAVLVAAACVVFVACTFTGVAEAEEPAETVEPAQAEAEPVNDPLSETDPAALPENNSLLEIPENLPTELMDLSRPAKEEGEWLLLAQTPGFDIALYRSAADDQHVYLRVTNQSFQRFDRDLSGMELLPTLEVVEGEADITVRALYRRYEGTYFNGTSNEPGIVAEQIFYDWDEAAKHWTEWTFSTQPAQRLTEDLPALEDLPTTLFDIPDAYQDPIWLIAELPEEDIAVYFEEETGRSWLRYGRSLQKLEIVGGLPITPRKLPPELYFQDLDGDGEKELAMIHNSDSGTGVSVWSLTVFEWDGEGKFWAAYPSRLEENIIRDFQTGHTLTRHLDENYVTVGFQGSTVDVDMDAMFGSYTAWKDEPLYAEITGMFSAYSMESYGLSLTLAGELRPASYDPTTSYGFEYTCNVYYEADGTFRSTWGYLDTEYPYLSTADASLLTPTFRNILRQFIDKCRSEGAEYLFTEKFAICDVNGDGKNELITQRNNTYVAGQVERVYDADGNELLAEYPVLTYYDNGYVTAGWSHNQGVAGDKLWPYTLYRYDGSAGKYVPEASVDGWDKSIRDTYPAFGDNDGDYYIDQSVIPFPDDVDKDGDGFVYYIITEEGGYAPVYGEPMDYADYALWVARYQGANRVDVTYYPLTEKNITLIG